MRNSRRLDSGAAGNENSDRGVSEVLSYTMVFSLILVAVAIVSVSGFTTLESVRDVEQAQNADRAYDVFANNMEDIYAEGAPSRATEIDLGESQLFIAEPTIFNVTVTEVSGKTSHVYDIRPVVYRLNTEQSLVYENGAVFQIYPQSGSIRRNPPQMFGSSRTHIPIVRTKSDAVQSIGSTTVLVRGEAATRSIVHSGVEDVTALHVNVTSPRADLWQRYYEERVDQTDGDCDRPADDRVICEITPPTRIFHVSLQDIKVSLIR